MGHSTHTQVFLVCVIFSMQRASFSCQNRFLLTAFVNLSSGRRRAAAQLIFGHHMSGPQLIQNRILFLTFFCKISFFECSKTASNVWQT
jgi:hypothetical protein